MSKILTREEFENFLHRAFSHVHLELDEDGRLKGAHSQPFNIVLAHDAALRAEVERLWEALEDMCREWRLHGQLTDSCRLGEAALLEGRK